MDILLEKSVWVRKTTTPLDMNAERGQLHMSPGAMAHQWFTRTAT